ncbi:MAG: hypothetical protein AAF152_06845 [Cyanobacteria bacterium P01_A01_bin.114]
MRSQPSADLESKIRLALGMCVLAVLVLLLLRLLLPWLLIGSVTVGSYLFWQRWRRQRQLHRAFLHSQFYQLIKKQQGQISVLDFAMQTQISGDEAKDYLNAQAKAFYASFEPTLQGDIVYVFNLTRVQSAPATIDIQPKV